MIIDKCKKDEYCSGILALELVVKTKLSWINDKGISGKSLMELFAEWPIYKTH